MREPAEMLLRFVGSLADDWNVKIAADHRSNLPKGYAFFRYRMVSDSSIALFEGRPINNGGI